MTLSDLPQGATAHVESINDPSPMGDRLLEMGLTPGTKIRVIRRSTVGQPMQIMVRGYRLSLRLENARFIEVKP
jgi:Fe2+ transport system protein FeoA